MKTAKFYLHLYLNKYGELVSSGWQGQCWPDYLHSVDRDESDLGDEKKTQLIETEEKDFIFYNSQWMKRE